MTHEFKKLLKNYLKNKSNGQKSVIATVVDLDGSSYRKPGVRMLIAEDGTMTGAVSGGCVEKEVLRQAESVLQDNTPKIMTYDGRYRLGCDGILYILIEPFNPTEDFINNFYTLIRDRNRFHIWSFFNTEKSLLSTMGSVVKNSDGKDFPFSRKFDLKKSEGLSTFKQEMKPCFRLLIVGGEHDAVQLCKAASFLGWDVSVAIPIIESKNITNFSKAKEVLNISPEEISPSIIDEETAIMIMSHHYAKDLKALIALKDSNPAYVGVLGPSKRREKLLSEFLQFYPEVEDSFLDLVYGPSGLNIGAETPQEIAISILSEILTVARAQKPFSLKAKKGKIHN